MVVRVDRVGDKRSNVLLVFYRELKFKHWSVLDCTGAGMDGQRRSGH